MATTEDQLNELRTTVSLMSMNLDKAVRAMSNLTARIEGIEQRQAKLACAEISTDAGDGGGNDTGAEWIELAGMLGFEVFRYDKGPAVVYCRTVHHPLDGTDHRFFAMLHGLACLECNGCAQIMESGSWWWEIWMGDDGKADTHPAALIAMLKAYRGQS